ncbi:uncharacterized protein J3R85_003891 [Psidium guajava]|nr:uncharacterized protein J3R85_003891 [Psidium guajava]
MKQTINALVIVRPLAASLYRFQKGKTSAFRNHDVFLSFRGPDSRTGFADFLYKGLVAAGHRVFRDEALPVGEQIEPEVLRAIRTCRIVIPIISDPYTKTKSCLRELTEIIDCQRKHGKSVFPVFYGVNVDGLGRRCSNFEEALGEYERMMQCRREEVQEWAKALCSVTRIRGWESQSGREGKLVKEVVAKVSSESETMWIKRYFSIPLYHYFSEKKQKGRKSEFQVFLAFRVPDIRPDNQVNLVDFLRVALGAEGIQVFDGDDQSLIGKDVANEISNAINHCKILIPILSENYASSHWCLEDLAQMVACKRTNGQKILPIFYKVDPLHVRDVSHLFGEYMLRHKYMVDKTTYERWEGALREVGSSDGWVLEKSDDEHLLAPVQKVVKEVSRLLNIH